MKHTPWPWIKKQLPEQAHPKVISVNGVVVAEVQYEEDALLISAAPDLLAACEAAYNADACEVDCNRDDPCGVWVTVRAAIAKAKGEKS